MTRKKKQTYGVLLGLGMAALAADRLLVGGDPTPASVEAAASLTNRSPADPAATGATERIPVPGVPFPRNLPAVAADALIRDAFANPGAGSGDTAGSRVRGPDGPFARPPTAAAFVDIHRLDAVMDDGALHIAVVDGRWVRPGERIDGCRLDRLEGIRAVFVCSDEEQAVLVIPGSGNTPPAKGDRGGHR
jgi:hypothetical protein